jgi:uroporphyrinogen-III synthase
MATGDLRGFTVAVTADRRRDEQATLLLRHGLDVRMHPLLSTRREDDGVLVAVTQALVKEPPDLLVANTGYGMRTWMETARQAGLAQPLAAALTERGTTIAARGAKALGELRKAGLDARFKAASETLDEVVSWAIELGVAGRRVAFQLHGEASTPHLDRLRAAGADLIVVPVYQMGEGAAGTGAALAQAVVEGEVDVVTFTAAPQVEALLDVAAGLGRLGAVLAGFNYGAVIAACIGPVCAAAAGDAGITQPLVPEHPRIGSLASAVTSALALRRLVLAGPGGAARLCGRYLEASGSETELSGWEQQVLRPLSAAPGHWADLPGGVPDGVVRALESRLAGALEVRADRRARLLPGPA